MNSKGTPLHELGAWAGVPDESTFALAFGAILIKSGITSPEAYIRLSWNKVPAKTALPNGDIGLGSARAFAPPE
jgi:hypothetical protein